MHLHLFPTARSAQSLSRQNTGTCIWPHGSPSGFKWLKGPVSVKVSSQRERGFGWRRALTSAAAFTLTVPNTESLQPPFRFLSFFFDRFQRLVIFLSQMQPSLEKKKKNWQTLNQPGKTPRCWRLQFWICIILHGFFFNTHHSTSSLLVKFQLISEKKRTDKGKTSAVLKNKINKFKASLGF